MGFRFVSVSSEVNPLVKVYPRASTTTLDAYLNKYIIKSQKDFQCKLNDFLGPTSQKPKIYFMQSDGGLCEAGQFRGANSILSGPAGGYTASFKIYQALKVQFPSKLGLIGLDMGGTSTDVSKYDSSDFDILYETQIAGTIVQTPHLNINTVAAGGGSRLFYKTGLLLVGPESSGAQPGPVCYGNQGFLSLTDANLVLGRVIPEFFPQIFGPSNDQPLNLAAATQQLASLNEQLNIENNSNTSVQELALGFVRVANENICRSVRQLTEAKGLECKKFILNVFGGAAGQHCCQVAENLNIDTIYIHQFAGILSAYGISQAKVRAESQESVGAIFTEVLQTETLPKIKQRLLANNCQKLEQNAKLKHTLFLNLKYQGTDSLIQIKETQPFQEYRCQFDEIHKKSYGFLLQNRSIVLEFASLVSEIAGEDQELNDFLPLDSVQDQNSPLTHSDCWFANGNQAYLLKIPVFQFEDCQNSSVLSGPCLILHNTSTLLVEPSWLCKITKQKNIILTRQTQETERNSYQIEPLLCNPIELSVFANRFMSIAEQMGKTLQSTSVSTNIKERLDFSCAIFDNEGNLVANAPHLPVHLGSMSEAVKHQIKYQSEWATESILANHPQAGGSHLPDLTVITPVKDPITQKNVFYVASRGHHADIGGVTPGSMPAFSKTIHDEGVATMGTKIVKDGIFLEDLVRELFSNPPNGVIGSRRLQDNISDLKAQVAANYKGSELLFQLVHQYSLAYVQKYMFFIQQCAEQSVRHMLVEISKQKGLQALDHLYASDFMDDGTQIKLKLTINRDSRTATFDFTGTGKQVFGNINCPTSVTLSSIIYCLKCLIRAPIPLNQGCLAPITVIIPSHSLLNPSEEAAIVGGNVLTSQKITDLIFTAFGACAHSYGCMNNFTFGNETISYYETIGGGSGAGNNWNGQSAVQCHMTNTRITDTEVLERLYPIFLKRFEVRQNSGGLGIHQGGDGITREYIFLAKLYVSILSERRVFNPQGLEGGGQGKKGKNEVMFNKQPYRVSLGAKNTIQVATGDVVIIKTPGGGGFGEPTQAQKSEEATIKLVEEKKKKEFNVQNQLNEQN